jgi:hypothetical protein
MTDPLSDLLDGDEDTPEPAANKPKTDNQLQAAQRKLNKAEQELEELRAWRAEREGKDRTESIGTVFKELNLNPKHAKFYPPDAEVTEDAVRAWAVTEEFLNVEEGGEPASDRGGFTPTVINESQALGSKQYSVQEWREIAMRNPAEGQQLLQRGRVLGVQITDDGRVEMTSLTPGLA